MSISAEKNKNIDMIFNLAVFCAHPETALSGIASTALSLQLPVRITKKSGLG
jgi:hypothetical protein